MPSDVWWIVLAGFLAPIAVGLLGRIPRIPRLPEVVFLLLFGIAIGPYGLGLAGTEGAVEVLKDLGLGFLFFMAGMEVDPKALRGKDGRLAIWAWSISLIVAGGIVGMLTLAGVVGAWAAIAIALTSTALGTLLPILKDADMAGGRFGRVVLANGAVGEFGPIIAMSILLGSDGTWAGVVSLLLFAGVGIVVVGVLKWARHHPGTIGGIIARGADTTAQAPVRATVALIVGLLVVASYFGLDTVLGAFVAGAIVRSLGPVDEKYELRMGGLAFGFFVPMFFVISGMGIDVSAVVSAPIDLVVAFVLIVVVRGGPVLLLYRRRLPSPQPLQLALLTATGLPMIVAVTALAVAAGNMPQDKASVSIAAGMVTVIVLPITALALRRRPAVETASV